MASKPSIKNKLIADCEAAGTYKPQFDRTIDLLTGILKRHEKVYREWKKDGEPFIVEEINTKGEPYTKKDPRIDILSKLEDSALKYLSALGLTPKALDMSESKGGGNKASISSFIERAEASAGMK